MRYISLALIGLSCNNEANLKQSQSRVHKLKKQNSIPHAEHTTNELKESHRKYSIEDLMSGRDMVHIADRKYRYDGDFNQYLDVTLINNTKHIVIGISFIIAGVVDKGCSKSYAIKQKVKMKPSQSITVSQLIQSGDCSAHAIERVQYVMKDGTIGFGF
ncbi:MAG: hypothetical protein ACOH2A_13635 [Sphingobacteriaceae bacterium]